jgi:hypothetical protein
MDLSIASSARDEMPWRTTSTHSRPDRGERGNTDRPPNNESADTFSMTFTVLPPAIWHPFYTKMAEKVVAAKVSPVRAGLPATFSE